MGKGNCEGNHRRSLTNLEVIIQKRREERQRAREESKIRTAIFKDRIERIAREDCN